MNKETFKAGDEVYCPCRGFSIYTLIYHASETYPIRIADGCSIDIYGREYSSEQNASIFHATPENKALLEALYKCEFESPKLKGSDLTRKLLSEGASSILCWVSDISDESSLIGKSVAIVSGIDGGCREFMSLSSSRWKYAVPCNDYANLPNGVLECKP